MKTHFHISTRPELATKSARRHYSAFMSSHTFVSITTTVAYICHKLTIMCLFYPIHSDDAFFALLPETKAKLSKFSFVETR